MVETHLLPANYYRHIYCTLALYPLDSRQESVALGRAFGEVMLYSVVSTCIFWSCKISARSRLTFGSFRTLGILKVARTEVRAAVVAKPRGDAPPISLEEKEELQRALGRAVRERRPALREAMVEEIERGDWEERHKY